MVTVLPTVGKQHSCLGLAILTQVLVVTPSRCGCRCATPFLRRVLCRSGSQTKKQRLFLYCSLFSTCRVFFLETYFFGSLSGHWPFAGDSEVSDWQPMALRNGVGLQFISRKSSRLSFSSTGSLRRSLRCTSACWLDFLSYLATDASNFQSAPDPSGGRGEMAIVAPCCHACYGTVCAVGLI